MPANVETMAFFGQVPWHGLGTQLEETDLYDWQRTCSKAGLDWEAELVPLITSDTGTRVDHRGVRRSSDSRILGVVGPRYTILQNKDAFKWFQPFLDAREAALHTAGSLCEGSRIWVLSKLNRDPLVIAEGDEVEKYILLSHAHDGSLAVRVGFVPVRVCCSNTLAMAHGSNASKLIRCKHTRDIHENLENIRETMNLANQEFESTAEQYKMLARKSINSADLEKYVKKVLQVQEPASTRMKHTIQEIMGLCEYGKGNDLPSIRNTYWSSYNGITEWLSHQRGNSQENRLNSLWYGDSANLNKFALQTACEMAA